MSFTPSICSYKLGEKKVNFNYNDNDNDNDNENDDDDDDDVTVMLNCLTCWLCHLLNMESL